MALGKKTNRKSYETGKTNKQTNKINKSISDRIQKSQNFFFHWISQTEKHFFTIISSLIREKKLWFCENEGKDGEKILLFSLQNEKFFLSIFFYLFIYCLFGRKFLKNSEKNWLLQMPSDHTGSHTHTHKHKTNKNLKES